MFKTLIASTTDDRHVVGVVPVATQLDLKALADAVDAKHADMAQPDDAQRLTGYVLGGISPLGQKRRLADGDRRSASAFDSVFVSGGRRGLEIELAPRRPRSSHGRDARGDRTMVIRPATPATTSHACARRCGSAAGAVPSATDDEGSIARAARVRSRRAPRRRDRRRGRRHAHRGVGRMARRHVPARGRPRPPAQRSRVHAGARRARRGCVRSAAGASPRSSSATTSTRSGFWASVGYTWQPGSGGTSADGAARRLAWPRSPGSRR